MFFLIRENMTLVNFLYLVSNSNFIFTYVLENFCLCCILHAFYLFVFERGGYVCVSKKYISKDWCCITLTQNISLTYFLLPW